MLRQCFIEKWTKFYSTTHKYAAAYLGDVVIHSSDWGSHLMKVQVVVDSLRRAEFTANPKKVYPSAGRSQISELYYREEIDQVSSGEG